MTKKALTENGIVIGTMPSPGGMLTQVVSVLTKKKYRIIFADPTPEKIAHLAGWVADKKLKVIVDREFAFNEISDAHRYSETKRAKGKIIIRVGN